MGTFGFLKNKKDNGKHLKKKLPKVNYRELEGLTTNCTWKGEKFSGISYNLYESGELEFEIFFKNGKPYLEKGYFENGNIQQEIPWKNFMRDGVMKLFYPNGNLRMEGYQVNDVKDGIFKMWDENGNLRLEENWSQGNKNGLKKEYDENGKIINEDILKDGIPIGKYNSLKDEYNIDFSDFTLYDTNDLSLSKFEKNSEYYLIYTDLHERGYFQLKKSKENSSNKIISEFSYDYDPGGCGDDEEDFDPTNSVNSGDFYNIQVMRVESKEFPILLKQKIIEYDNDSDNDDMSFLEWLDPELEYLNYESTELIIDSLGLQRDNDLKLLFENCFTSEDLTTNPFVISWKGYTMSDCGGGLYIGVKKINKN